MMVVLGAGASYDSSPDFSPPSHDNDIRPPLTQGLFSLRGINAEAAENFPRCQLVLDQLRNLRPDTSVEQELEKLRDEAAPDYQEVRRQLVSIQFYLQWVISKTQHEWNQRIHRQTNYRTLLGQIDRHRKGEQVCFVTFNYDTLLEEAFSSLSKPFSSLDDYVSGDYKIIKLHGSVNWARELTGSNPTTMGNQIAAANESVSMAEKLQVNERFHIADLNPLRNDGWICAFMDVPSKPARQRVFPAIAIPFVNKTNFECPAEHQKVLKECISRTDKLLIIGWKGAEVNFINLLFEGLSKDVPKMMVSRNRESARKIVTTTPLQAIISLGRDWLAETGFTGELRSGQIEHWTGRFHRA